VSSTTCNGGSGDGTIQIGWVVYLALVHIVEEHPLAIQRIQSDFLPPDLGVLDTPCIATHT
jgi:hypothetical protein